MLHANTTHITSLLKQDPTDANVNSLFDFLISSSTDQIKEAFAGISDEALARFIPYFQKASSEQLKKLLFKSGLSMSTTVNEITIYKHLKTVCHQDHSKNITFPEDQLAKKLETIILKHIEVIEQDLTNAKTHHIQTQMEETINPANYYDALQCTTEPTKQELNDLCDLLNTQQFTDGELLLCDAAFKRDKEGKMRLGEQTFPARLLSRIVPQELIAPYNKGILSKILLDIKTSLNLDDASFKALLNKYCHTETPSLLQFFELMQAKKTKNKELNQLVSAINKAFETFKDHIHIRRLQESIGDLPSFLDQAERLFNGSNNLSSIERTDLDLRKMMPNALKYPHHIQIFDHVKKEFSPYLDTFAGLFKLSDTALTSTKQFKASKKLILSQKGRTARQEALKMVAEWDISGNTINALLNDSRLIRKLQLNSSDIQDIFKSIDQNIDRAFTTKQNSSKLISARDRLLSKRRRLFGISYYKKLDKDTLRSVLWQLVNSEADSQKQKINNKYLLRHFRHDISTYLDQTISSVTANNKFKQVALSSNLSLLRALGFRMTKLNGNITFLSPMSATNKDSVITQKDWCKKLFDMPYPMGPSNYFQADFLTLALKTNNPTLREAAVAKLATKEYRDVLRLDKIKNRIIIDKDFRDKLFTKLDDKYAKQDWMTIFYLSLLPKSSTDLSNTIVRKIFIPNNVNKLYEIFVNNKIPASDLLHILKIDSVKQSINSKDYTLLKQAVEIKLEHSQATTTPEMKPADEAKKRNALQTKHAKYQHKTAGPEPEPPPLERSSDYAKTL